MDIELEKKLIAQDEKLTAILRSTERTRKIFLWTLIISVATIVLPMIGLAFVIPTLMRSMNLGSLGL